MPRFKLQLRFTQAILPITQYGVSQTRNINQSNINVQ